ncbi:MAG: DUF4184 domain-containing protein [Firmicutes bacterium HGW-Firmicutes-1]|jgi:hypothetical protein|nr:MAG: DUF4184 domain-containing protein [Firmicutes bacterium HGW-Firmicutes-1]
MPFTFAHPLAVLPLGKKKNKYFDFTALIIGSMAPDFEYFIHFKPYQMYGHTLLGQLFYNMPLVIIIAFIYHYILKESIIINLPNPYSTYYNYLIKKRWTIFSKRAFIMFVYSALIGMFTHLIWDSFTHIEGYFVTKIVILSKSITLINYKIPIYKILQHGSTVIGLTIIVFCLWKIKEINPINNLDNISKVSKARFWIGFIVISIFIEIIAIFLLKDFSIGSVIVGFISSGFIGITLNSLINKRIR